MPPVIDNSVFSNPKMSLEATLHLWISRVDPRRRRHAVGMYSHVLDQWGIVYDQPIILNRRQAGCRHRGGGTPRTALGTGCGR